MGPCNLVNITISNLHAAEIPEPALARCRNTLEIVNRFDMYRDKHLGYRREEILETCYYESLRSPQNMAKRLILENHKARQLDMYMQFKIARVNDPQEHPYARNYSKDIYQKLSSSFFYSSYSNEVLERHVFVPGSHCLFYGTIEISDCKYPGEKVSSEKFLEAIKDISVTDSSCLLKRANVLRVSRNSLPTFPVQLNGWVNPEHPYCADISKVIYLKNDLTVLKRVLVHELTHSGQLGAGIPMKQDTGTYNYTLMNFISDPEHYTSAMIPYAGITVSANCCIMEIDARMKVLEYLQTDTAIEVKPAADHAVAAFNEAVNLLVHLEEHYPSIAANDEYCRPAVFAGPARRPLSLADMILRKLSYYQFMLRNYTFTKDGKTLIFSRS